MNQLNENNFKVPELVQKIDFELDEKLNPKFEETLDGMEDLCQRLRKKRTESRGLIHMLCENVKWQFNF